MNEEIEIFDTHAHYDDEAFDEDRERVIGSLKEKGIKKIMDVGASLESCERVALLMEQYSFIYGAIGIHPSDTEALNEENYKRICELSKKEKCLAIGEIGLDYHYPDPSREIQKNWFARQINLAKEVKKPIIIHSREAYKDTVDVMTAEKAKEVGGVIHCYSYTKETAKTFLDMDFFFGIGGVVTFKNAKKLVEAVEYIPMERIVLETDCPYLAPEPVRGSRNYSGNLLFVAEKIAKIKDIPVEEVIKITWDNAHRLYRIK